jgi:phosphoglycolate phosphatase-like HAD superfamily hydrolase
MLILNTEKGNITMFTHIIWDFDGTLFDTYPAMGRSFSNLLKEKGHDESTNEILKYMKVSMSHAYSHYKDKYQIDDAFIEIYSQHRHELELKMCNL